MGVLSFIQSLRLSVQGYLILSLAALSGLLVGLLKLQGSRLHAAQVALLAAQLKARQDQDDTAIEAARARYEEALKAYRGSL